MDGAGVTASTSGSPGGVLAYPLISKGRTSIDTINYFLGVTADGHIAAAFESVSDDVNHGLVGTTSIPTGTWHHAAATYDGNTFAVYLDGALEASVATTSGPGNTNANHAALATTMSQTGVAAGFFNGAIDEARIWNVGRTPAQVAASMNLQLTSGSGLIGRWGMEEGAGSTVGNSIAGGVNGTAVAGTAWVPGAPFVAAATPHRLPRQA